MLDYPISPVHVILQLDPAGSPKTLAIRYDLAEFTALRRQLARFILL